MHEFVATSTPVRTKVKTTGRRKSRNSRRSVSLLDVSAVDAKPDISSQISESNETLASGFKDSGYVRSDASSLYDDETKEAKTLAEELKFKDVLICELQESNRGLRLRCADAEDKIWRLRVKCEAHCGCCPNKDSETALTAPESGTDEKDAGAVDGSSKDAFRFKFSDSPIDTNRMCQSFSCRSLSSTKPLVRSSSTGTIAKSTAAHMQGAQSPQESLSFSKVQKWQKDLMLQKLSSLSAVQNPESCSSAGVFHNDSSVSARNDRYPEKTRPQLSADGRFEDNDYCLPNHDGAADAGSESECSFDGSAFQNGLISPIEHLKTRKDLDTIVDFAHVQFGSAASDKSDSKSHKALHEGRQYIPSSTPVEDPSKVAECQHCNCKPTPYVIVVPTSCCSCCKASPACLSPSAPSFCCQGHASHLRATPDTPSHCTEPFCEMKTKQTINTPREKNNHVSTEPSTSEVSLDLSGRLNVPFTQGFDPKNEYKRRIEEGMKKLASDARAEADSLSFKPWPVPDFTDMSPLMQCLAETSHYARQMAIGLSKVNSRVQRMADTPNQLSSAV